MNTIAQQLKLAHDDSELLQALHENAVHIVKKSYQTIYYFLDNSSITIENEDQR